MLVGTAAANVVVNGAGVKVGNGIYRFQSTKRVAAEALFKTDPLDPRNTVEVQFLAGSFRDIQGATNKSESEQFYVFFPPTPTTRRSGRPDRRAAEPRSAA